MAKKEIGFTKVETIILETKALSSNEKLFYCILKSFRNRQSKQCFPSMRRVADRCGMSKNTAYKSRTGLQHLGIIEYSTERGRKHRNQYRFILEDGEKQAIERVLSVLQSDIIAQNEDSQNSAKEGQRAVPILGNKIAQNEDSNQKKVTRRSTTTQKSVVCDEVLNKKDELPKDVENYITLKVAHTKAAGSLKGTTAAYRAGLIKIWRRGELDISDIEELKEKDGWDVAKHLHRQEREDKLDKASDAYKLIKLIFDLNVERNPGYKAPEFFNDEVGYIEALLKTNPPNEVEDVLRFHHSRGGDTFLWDAFLFTSNFEQLQNEKNES